jgi:hypothetical protein
MKYTLEFEEKDEALRALLAQDAWNSLWEINQYIRSHIKHDVPADQTIACIKEELQHILKYID